MTIDETVNPTPRKPLRLWPGVVAAVLLALARFGIKAVVPGFKGFVWGAQGGLIGAAAVLLWWLFLSRAPWSERLGGIVLMIAAMGAAWGLRHGSMGPFWLFVYAVPVLCLAFVAAAVASRRLADRPRRAAMAGTIVLACGMWTLVRTEGITGDHAAIFSWRWTKSAEERLIARADEAPAALTSAPAAGATPDARPPGKASNEPGASAPPPAAETPGKRAAASPGGEPTVRPADPARAETAAAWPGFRGPRRDGIVRGVRIETNWSVSPPVELWRRPVGPGWSSFAVAGNLVYTQDQRGDDEGVAAYNLTTGQPVWRHRDAARFFESNAGPGPRATPTVSDGRVYTFGATGILNALDAASGAVVWSRNAATDTGTKVPYWGFSSSPVVVDDLVIVAVAGRLAAYDIASGKPRWSGAAGEGYSSPHLATIGGVTQIVLMSDAGAAGVAPADGKVLWQHARKNFPIVQPAVTADGDVLFAAGSMRRIAVAQGSGGWTVAERWSSDGLKPYFNDFVVHEGHVYGFDGRILACIDLNNGKRKWKGGRYGNGQLVLLADQDVLLVLSEEGELALVSATADAFREIARFRVLQSKTWNHPVVVGNVVLVRNGEEMAAFRLAPAGALSMNPFSPK